jgi:hypothetical protein
LVIFVATQNSGTRVFVDELFGPLPHVAGKESVSSLPAQCELLADEASRKAVDLNDSRSEAHAARAFALSNLHRWTEADF